MAMKTIHITLKDVLDNALKALAVGKLQVQQSNEYLGEHKGCTYRDGDVCCVIGASFTHEQVNDMDSQSPGFNHQRVEELLDAGEVTCPPLERKAIKYLQSAHDTLSERGSSPEERTKVMLRFLNQFKENLDMGFDLFEKLPGQPTDWMPPETTPKTVYGFKAAS